MLQNDNQGTLCALTEQGDLGLGVHAVENEKERADLKRRLNEMQNQTSSQSSSQTNRR